MESLQIEVKFAQSLAANEQKLRHKALKKLKKYLKAKSSSKKDGFTAEDFLKLWKGLHYCLWMQDKPLLHEEICTNVSQLIHELSTFESQMLFIKVFFMTEAREWASIDIWRLDKFMMLVRNMLNESLIVVKRLKWELNHLDQFVQVLSDFVMNPDTDTTPTGLKIHFCDVYLDEVEKVGDEYLTGSHLLKLLFPFVKFLQKGTIDIILQRTISCVFDPIIKQAVEKVRLRNIQNTDEENEMETNEVPFMSLKFDIKMIADHLFALGQENCVLSRNRPKIYDIVKRLQDIEGKVLPQEKEIVVSQGVTSKDIRLAVHDLKTFDAVKKGKKKHKKKAKKLKQKGNSEKNENTDTNNNAQFENNDTANDEQSTSSIIIGKRKHPDMEQNDEEPVTKIRKKKVDGDNKPEGSSNEDTALKKLRNKFAKLDMLKGKKGKKTEVNAVDKTGTPSSLKKSKGKEDGKEATKNTPKAFRKSEKPADIETENVSENTEQKPNEKTGMVKDSHKSVVKSESTPDNKVKMGKRKFSQTEALGNTPEALKKLESPAINVKLPDVVVESEKTPDVVKSESNNSDLQEGEIEIFVPNKKYKGNKNGTPNQTFAAFDETKPPVAFVRKSLSKLKKTPSSLKVPSSAKTPGSAKRVCFDLKQNKSQAYKESLNSPMTPFNPEKKAEMGILKSPAPICALASSSLSTGSSEVTSQNTNTSNKTPVSRLAAQKVLDKKVKTPVLSVERKKAKPMRRMKAADFFL